jgi:hypothetical protein
MDGKMKKQEQAMRPIKFRGLRTDGKGWVYGDLMTNGSITHISNFDNGVKREQHEVKPETVGQFVDMNEAWEGDCDNDGWFVVFKDGAFMLQWGNNLFKPIDRHFSSTGTIHDTKTA